MYRRWSPSASVNGGWVGWRGLGPAALRVHLIALCAVNCTRPEPASPNAAVRPAAALRGGRLFERALEQRGQHDLRLGARHARMVAQALQGLLEVGGVACADVQHRAGLPRHRVAGLDLGMALDGLAHLGGRHAALGEERHERVRAPAIAAGVYLRGVAADDAVGLEPVDAPLDGRRGQRDAHPDALERAPGVLAQERNDLAVDVVHWRVIL